jgi:hypothetical protein
MRRTAWVPLALAWAAASAVACRCPPAIRGAAVECKSVQVSPPRDRHLVSVFVDGDSSRVIAVFEKLAEFRPVIAGWLLLSVYVDADDEDRARTVIREAGLSR